MQQKYFHVSDLLALVTGYKLSVSESMVAPDGTPRKEYVAPLQGVVELVGFVTGVDLSHPADPMRFQAEAFYDLAPHAEEAVLKQFPQLKEVKFPVQEYESLGSAGKQTKFMKDWAMATIYSLDMTWAKVDAMTEAEQQELRKTLPSLRKKPENSPQTVPDMYPPSKFTVN